MVRRAALALCAVAACGDAAPVLAPVIEAPAPPSEADPFPNLEELGMAVALAGDDRDLVAARFERGETVELPGIPYADDLVVHLEGLTGAAQTAYGRTCSFDLRPGVPPPSPHLYFARPVKWADAPRAPARVRIGGWALVAADGSGLFGGGETAADPMPVAEIDRFDPRTGEASEPVPLEPRTGAAAARLGDGRIVIIGGVDPGTGGAAAFVELVDPLAGIVDRIDDAGLRVARVGLATAALADGRVVAIGGEPPAGGPTGSVVAIRADGGSLELRPVRAALAFPRADATATRLSDDIGAPVLVVGGRGADGKPIAEAELYKPLREAFADPLTFTAKLSAPRSRHAAVRMPDGSVLVVGGVDGDGVAVRTMELFSPDGGFAPVGALPDDAGVVDMSVTTLPDGRVLLAGGRAPGGPPLDTAFIARLDPLDGSVDLVGTDRLTRPRAGHQALTLCDGTVLLAGGTADEAPAERYNPPPNGRR